MCRRGVWRFIACLLLIPASVVMAKADDLPVIAVARFTSTVDSDSWRDYLNSKPKNLEAMIETQLIRVGRFKVFERNRLDQILAEQGLQSALAANGTKLRIAGVDYLLYGSITEFSSQQRSIRTGSFASSSLVTRFGIDVKIVDVLTGEIRRAENIAVTEETGSGIATGEFRHQDEGSKTLSDVQRRVAKLAAAAIAESIFPIRVVDASSDVVYINYGDSILTVGDELRVIREGQELMDPETGKRLGSEESTIATLKVFETTASFSKAKVVDGTSPKKRDLVRVVLAPREDEQEQRKPLGRKI
jgi:curli biogenesis system outer membrane secretion channel CsgG